MYAAVSKVEADAADPALVPQRPIFVQVERAASVGHPLGNIAAWMDVCHSAGSCGCFSRVDDHRTSKGAVSLQ